VRVLFWLLFLPFAVIGAVFAVNNSGEVALSLDPLPYTISLPLYMAVLLAALAGFFLGSVLVWLAQGKWRRLARRNARQVNTLERDLSVQREESAHRATMAAEVFPSVPGSEIAERK